MPTVIPIGDRRELFVDHALIERMQGCALKLHEPVSGGVAIKLDRPWEGPANFGASVIYHGGRYLMYYRAMTLDEDQGVMCVAESSDGVEWTKPALGSVERAGCRDTNMVTSNCATAEFSYYSAPWVDTRPDVPDDERIKALTSEPVSGERHTAFADPVGPKRAVAWGSADGFSFRKLSPQPGIVSNLLNCFDGGNTAFWSEAEQAYVFYYRFYDGEWGEGGRTVARTTSKDFLHWSEPVPMTYGGTPREQFYTNNTTPYFRAPHIYVALAARFMEGRQAVTDAQAVEIGLRRTRGIAYNHDCSDGVLLTSRAASTEYDRTFMEGFIRPGIGASNWVSRTNYPLTGIFPFGTDQMMLWVTRHYVQDTWHIERMLLRLDGFASVTAPWAGGELVTKPFTFSGSKLEINYRTSAAGSVRVEMLNEQDRPIAGHTMEDCAEIVGDEIARTVTWRGGSDAGSLAGQPVRMRFVMKDADLFSFRFGDDLR